MHVFSQACGRDEESERGVRRNRICHTLFWSPDETDNFLRKGGVGKTTILSNLARLLARDGYRVLVIDCDPSMNLAMSLGIPLSDVVSLAKDSSIFGKARAAGRESRSMVSTDWSAQRRTSMSSLSRQQMV